MIGYDGVVVVVVVVISVYSVDVSIHCNCNGREKNSRVIIFIYEFIYRHSQDSLINSNELLSIKVMSSLRNTYKGAYGISSD